jgi:uncharacterized protein (DUF2147 family)
MGTWKDTENAVAQKLDRKQIYELRKECGKSALEYSKKSKLCDGVGSYESHYNVKLNVCFIYRISTCGKRDWQESVDDVNENKQYARYVGSNKLDDKPTHCYVVGNKRCKSLAEFKELIKLYMEE